MANVTSSGNTTIRPKINVAKFMGSAHAAGSTVGEKVENNTITINWLAADIRKNLINIETLAQVVEDVSLRSESDTKKDDNQDQKLDEIHSTLIDIGNALSLDFANRITGMKEQEDELKGAKSRRRFKREESQLEKSSKNVGNIITRTGSKMISPFQDIFSKIISFLGVLGTGIVVNEAFKWLSDPENQAKIGKFFKILVKNWKWIVGTIGVLGGVAIIGSLIGLSKALAGILAVLTNPVFLGVLAIAGSGMGAKWMLDKITEYFDDDPTGEKNFIGGPIPGAPKDANPGDYFQDNKGKWWIKQDFDSSNGGWSGPRNKPPSAKILKMTGGVELQREGSINKVDNNSTVNQINKNTINKINKNITNNKIDAISKKPGINLIPMDLPAITAKMPEISTPSGPATEAPDIASTNGADQYRYITSSIYGIFV